MTDLVFRLILPMGLAGSAVLALLLLLRPALRRGPARGQKAGLTLAAGLFVVPLPLVVYAIGTLFTPTQAAAINTTLQQTAPTAPLYNAGGAVAGALNAAPVAPAVQQAAQQAPAPLLPHPTLLLSTVYLIGLLVAVCIYLHRYRAFMRGTKSAAPVQDAATLALYDELCAKLGIQKPPRLLYSDAVASPVLVGLIHPRILLPGALCDGGEGCAFALRHELLHHKHGDIFVKQLVQAVTLVHWFNPLAYLLRREMAEVCEQSCDEAVAATLSGAERMAYAHALLSCAEMRVPYTAVGFASPAGRLKKRLHRLLHPAKARRGMRAAVAGATVLVLCAGLLVGCTFAAGVSGLEEETPLPTSEPEPEEMAEEPVGGVTSPDDVSSSSDMFMGYNAAFPHPLPDATGVAQGFSLDTDGGHRGMDFSADEWTPVYSINAGTVTTAGWHYSYGYYVVLDHGGGMQSLYAHCAELAVTTGDVIEASQLIGYVGSTGSATSNILHFEILLDGEAQDPANYLPPLVTITDGSLLVPLPGYSHISRGVGGGHQGIDFAAPEGTPVVAAADGTVTFAGWDDSNGNYIEIDHGGDMVTRYCNNSGLLAETGQTVAAGQSIASVGSTGQSTGNHLHFELRVDGQIVDPMDYFTEAPV